MKKSLTPTIRKGQRKPYVKGTHRQIDERIGFVGRLLNKGVHKCDIHNQVRTRFNVEWRQCDRYIAIWLARARARTSSNIASDLAAQIEFIYGDKSNPEQN